MIDGRIADAGCPGVGREADDATIVARVAGGDRAAFAELYGRHSGPLFRTAFAVTRDKGVAEDLLQEAFLRGFRHIGRVQLAPGASLRPWLHRILINLAYDWSARQRTAEAAVGRAADRFAPESMVSPERHLEARESQRLVRDALDELPFKQRIVIILFYLHEMDLAEISITLNVPAGTVKSRLHYGRARLKSVLETDARLPVALGVRYASA